jgi:hypothetical protein
VSRNSVSMEFRVDGILCRLNSVEAQLYIWLKSLFFKEAILYNEQIIHIGTNLIELEKMFLL